MGCCGSNERAGGGGSSGGGGQTRGVPAAAEQPRKTPQQAQPSPPPAAPLPTPPAATSPSQRTLRVALRRYSEAFARKDVQALLKSYDAAACMRVYRQDEQDFEYLKGEADIGEYYDCLFRKLRQADAAAQVEPVVEEVGGAGVVMLVWTAPEAGLRNVSDTIIFSFESWQIVRHNTVVTSCAGEPVPLDTDEDTARDEVIRSACREYVGAFGQGSPDLAMRRYTDSSVLHCVDHSEPGKVTSHQGMSSIRSHFDGLFSRLSSREQFCTPLAHGESFKCGSVGGQLLLIWRSPTDGVPWATETMVMDPQGRCLRHFVAIKTTRTAAAAAVRNSAFIFLKPGASTEGVARLVRGMLAGHGIAVCAEGEIPSSRIDAEKLIDQHYYSIASKATLLQPRELNVPAERFDEKFGISWEDALEQGLAMNAIEACDRLALTPATLNDVWRKAKRDGDVVKFGGGFYCARVAVGQRDPAYVFNGFFMSMRERYSAADYVLKWLSVEWDASVLSYHEFRECVLGTTDPKESAPASMRGRIFAEWRALGLTDEPNMSANGVHASASPFEALCERMNWLGESVADSSFGSALLANGVEEDSIREWALDPQVNADGGRKGSLFDVLEGLDAADCVSRLSSLSA